MTANHRPDIDGLRALAVISVVLYHLHPPAVPAGFFGVDVFFVISGYLITAQLWASRDKPLDALLLDFYARRARRILPSLAIVVIATLGLGKLYLLPGPEQLNLAKSAIASTIFVSNVFFWRRQEDYFSRHAELQPLLHTWSLAVEEQFYLFWPLLLAALWLLARCWSRRHAKTGVLAGTAFISFLSLALCIAWAAKYPGAAFFLMPSRFWELGSGAALAMILARTEAPRLPNFAGLAGLAGVVTALFLYTSSTPYPGIAALLPVAGTALLIAAGAARKSGLAYRLLTWRPMIVTGEISYSWYLWHWPLIAIARAQDLGRHDLGRDAALALLAYLLAYLSTRFLETPIRKKRIALFSTARISLLTGFCLLLLMVLLSGALWMSAQAIHRSEFTPASSDCQEQGDEMRIESEGPCILAQGEHATIFLIGDSHATHWSPVIASWANAAGARAIGRTISGCPSFLAGQRPKDGFWLADNPEDCAKFSQLVMAEIEQTAAAAKPTAAVLSIDWLGYPIMATPLGHLRADWLDGALTRLERAGTSVLVIGPTPGFDHNPQSCVLRRGEQACRITRGQHDAKVQAVNAMLFDIVARHPRVRIWDPSSQYCDASYCYPSRNGSLLFLDEEHLTMRGAQVAAPDLSRELNWLLQPRPEAPRR